MKKIKTKHINRRFRRLRPYFLIREAEKESSKRGVVKKRATPQPGCVGEVGQK